MHADQPRAHLRTRWQALAVRLGIAQGAPAAALLDELAQAYAQPGRHYHNLDHIAALLELLDRHGHDVRNRDAMELAIFFHDAVYVPTRSDNEAASAALAREQLTGLGVQDDLIAEVERLILATRHGQSVADAGSDPEGSTTRLAYDQLSEGFGPGFNGPFLVVGELPEKGGEAGMEKKLGQALIPSASGGRVLKARSAPAQLSASSTR
jgi:hypothetical protein